MKRVHWANPVKREMVVNAEPTTDGKIQDTLGNTVEVTVNGDYGYDHAAISEKILQELADKNVFVKVISLSEPIRMSLGMQSEEEYFVLGHKKARISLTLKTLEGSLRLRNVEFLVFDEQMDEVLLSRPLLLSLRFELDAHLTRAREQLQDIDCSNVGFEPY